MTFVRRALLCLLSVVALACPGPQRPPPEPAQPASDTPLALSSSSACRADADCAEGLACFQGDCVRECTAEAGCEAGESCARGRCVTGGAVAAKEAHVALHVTNAPQTHFFATSAAPVVLHLELDAAVPAAGLAYRVERSDDPLAGATLLRVHGAQAIDIPIPVGAADPSGADARVVDTTIYTPVGRYAVRIEPQQPVAGAYAGTLAFLSLGTVPVELQVVTSPPNASLESATARWVVLAATASGFLSPQDVAVASPTQLAAPLTFEPISGKYVALFNHAFALGSGSSLLFSPAAGTSGRGLRFELEQGLNGTLTGQIVDVWSGLYELQGAGGVPAPATTYAVGQLDARRTGVGLSPTEVMGLPAGAAPPSPVAAPLPPLGACTPAVLPSLAPSCPADLAAFAALPALARATCANDTIAAALSAGGTVTAKLTEYTSSTPPATGSFQAFLGACAAGTSGTCVPSPTILCGRQLAAHAFMGLDADPAAANVVLQSYLDATREATLGQQLAAFWSDYQARLDWLQTDGAPSIIASALTADSVARLAAWKTAVLDRHLATLSVQLDPSARAIFARTPADPTLASARVGALVLVSQTCRGAADSLTFMVRRWNVLLQGDAARAAAAADARVLARDLYLAASVVTGLSGPNGGLATAPFRGAFGSLVRNISELGLPFQNLVFARDAEVVVSTSLDPSSSTASILSQRRQAALSALETATTQVSGVVDGVITDGLNQLQFSAALATELQGAQADLQRLCGLPPNCTVAELGTTAACAPRVALGACGFTEDQAGQLHFEAEISASRAGAQVLEVVKASKALAIATAARDAQANTVAYSQLNLQAFADSVQVWNQKRADGLAQMNSIFAAQTSLQDTALQTMITNQKLISDTRLEAIAGDAADLEKWNELKVGAATTTFEALGVANAYATTSSALGNAAEITEFVTEGFADPLKLGTYLVAGAVDTVLRAGSVLFEALAASKELSAQRAQTLADLQVENLMARADLEGARTDAELADLQAAIDRSTALSQAQQAQLNRALQLGQEQRAAELAFGRDLSELNDKRLAHFALLQQMPRYDLEVEQAALAVQQRILEYRLTVQDAQLAEARRALLQSQYTNAASLLGSPAVVFARVNRLDRAELYLQTARERLMNWLTALEYLAVRPFVDHRMRILLARNPLQLERVALSLEELQATCGGNTSQASLEVSVRDNLIGLDQPIADVDGTTVTPADRFRAMLQRGSVPIDRRVRYSTDSTVGGLLSRDRGVLAASFTVSLEDFGNLSLACNAKMVGFEVSLVGDLGSGLPVVTVLYDGTSHVRSCQPDIDAYVNTVGGRRWTNFGAVTLFHAKGRSASPNAGINGFLAGDNTNVTLDGLPLASEYTLIIDTAAGSNAQLDWSRLEDVRLRIKYGYQDLFAAGQCRE